MSLYSASVKKPITTLVVFIGVIILGIYSFFYLPVDFFPKLEPPIITVFTFYQGANASDIEENITKRLENNFSTLTNLKKITSTSKENTSVLMLEFEWGKNLDEATNEVRDALGRAERYLPADAEKPVIFKFSASMVPVIIYSVTADQSYAALTDILDNKVVAPLNRIDGVGSVMMIGGPIRAVMVDIDPRKLDAYNLSLEQIGNALRTENIDMPAGNIEMGMVNYPVRVEGRFTNSDQVKDIIISNINSKVVYLKDVATVRDDLKKATLDDKTNGRKSVRLMVQKQSGANTVQVAKDVKAKLAEVSGSLPEDVKIETVIDTSDYIQKSISNLTETIYFAILFVILIVLFFLGSWRATFIVFLSIPTSLIVSFIYLFLTDNSLNIITLSSISIAIGLVVDDAIVVLENIVRNMKKGSFPREAAIYGTNEVAMAVIATTLTIIAVFLPLTMLGDLTGEIFAPLGAVVTITIATSVIVSLTLTPMMASRILKISKTKKEAKSIGAKVAVFNEKIITAIDAFYEKTLKFAVNNRPLIIILAILIFGSSLFLVNRVGFEFMPASDNGRISAQVELIEGTRLDITTQLARKIEAIIKEKYPEIEIISTSAGSAESGSMLSIFQKSGSYIISFIMTLPPVEERTRDIFEISDLLRQDLAGFPEIVKYSVNPGSMTSSMSSSSFGMSVGGGSTIEVKIFGHDFNNTNIVAEQVSAALKKIEGTRDVTISRDKEKPELQVKLNRDKMSNLALSTVMVSSAIRNRINGLTATQYREEGEEYDIIINYDEKFRQSTVDLENMTIQNMRGQLIRLGDIASVEQYFSPPNIERENKERLVKVTAFLMQTDLSTVTAELNRQVSQMNIPPEIEIEYGGSAKDMQDSFRDLIILLVLSIVLVYIVMASQFESFREPFIIMFSLPFAFTGVFLALWISGTTLNVISFIGAIMLVGIVVKNGIILVDYTNLLRDRGVFLKSAVVQGGRLRLRPVLMTSLTMILAMIPLVLSKGEGSEIWRPMGISLMGGLTFSTLITLIVIPVIYTIFGAARMKRERKNNPSND
ncbi:MAG TPA: efflux RND transporter permease subunit [Bacteroidales bacterium]|nr:efflux RND transporter permease subunit [Bacteroidales bacterium]